jgi:hypothetical protein
MADILDHKGWQGKGVCCKGTLDFTLTFFKSSLLMANARMSSPCRTLLIGSVSS